MVPSASFCNASTLVFADAFKRDQVDGWGVPDPGPPGYYVLRGGNQRFSVDGVTEQGMITCRQQRAAAVVDVGSHERFEVAAEIALDTAPSSIDFRAFGSLALRDDGAQSFYEARLNVVPATDAVQLQIVEVNLQGESLAASVIDPNPTAGQRYRLHFQVDGFGPVQLRAAAWRLDDQPPQYWSVVATANSVKSDTRVGAHAGTPDPTGTTSVSALFSQLSFCEP